LQEWLEKEKSNKVQREEKVEKDEKGGVVLPSLVIIRMFKKRGAKKLIERKNWDRFECKLKRKHRDKQENVKV
jgi:hypothetical protein